MQHTLYLVTGASGSGKSTLMHSIMQNELISFTTRAPRIGEQNNKDYIFLSRDEFNKLDERGELAEKSEYDGNYYGLTQEQLNKLQIDNAFFVCNYHGAQQMKEIYPNCVSIFIMADKEDVKQNMIDRGDSQKKIDARLLTYEQEIANSEYYDFIVVNKRGRFEETRKYLLNIIEHMNV